MLNLFQRSKRIGKFIYFPINKIFSKVSDLIKELKLYHDKLQQYDEKTQTVPYYELWIWAVEVFQFGFLTTIVYINLFIFTGWLKIICFFFTFGVIRWLWLDFVENTSNLIRGKK